MGGRSHNLLMGSIAYIRYVLGKGLRVIEGYMDAMLECERPPSIWRRTCAQAIYIAYNHTKMTYAKTHVLVADSYNRQGQMYRAQV